MEEQIQTAPVEKNSSRTIVISAIVIIAALLVVYSLMRGGQSFGDADQNSPNGTSSTQEDTDQFGPQSNSDELNSIEADLNASTYDNLDPNAQ